MSGSSVSIESNTQNLGSLLTEPYLITLPTKILSALAYYYAILQESYNGYNAMQAHEFALEFEETGGLGMTLDEMLAAKSWNDGQHPSSIILPSEIGIAAGIAQFIGYTLRRLFKDTYYLWKMRTNNNANDKSVLRKKRQRKLRLGLSISSFLLGAVMIEFVAAMPVFYTLVTFIEVLLLGVLATVGISTGALPAILLAVLGGFALAFMVNFITHHAIRFYNWICYKDTNPLLAESSIEKRKTGHTYAKIIGPVLGIGAYAFYTGSLAFILTASALVIIIPIAYFGYKIVDSIFNDLAYYKDYNPHYWHALLKICGLVLVVTLMISPTPFAFLLIAPFFKIVYDHYQALTKQENDDGLKNISSNSFEIHQKAKFKLERNNLLSALIDWPAKIIARHIHNAMLAKNKGVAILAIFVLPPVEITRDVILLGVRFIARLINVFFKKSPSEPGIFYRLIQLFDFTQGTAYGRKHAQNTWKSKQAKETIEYEKMGLTEKVNENKTTWSAMYSHKQDTAKNAAVNHLLTSFYNQNILGLNKKVFSPESKSTYYERKANLS